MTTTFPTPVPQGLNTTSDDDVARAIALLSEGLLTRAEFHALTGIDAQNLPQYLADKTRLARVQRTAVQLRNSGVLVRLEAVRHAREAVEVAAQIMRNTDMHASNRLNAAAFIAKVSGTDRPIPDTKESTEKFSVTINIGGDRPPIVIQKSTEHTVTDEDSLSTE